MISKCTICGSKKSRFIKKQKASRILSNLGLNTPLSKVPIITWYLVLNTIIKMNEIVINFSVKFMSEIHLKQPGFTFSAHGSFTKNKERTQKF